MCRHHIRSDSLLELPAEAAKFAEADDTGSPIKSAKIDELVKYLKIFDPQDKTLVFSQFTSFLDHVGTSLKAAGISYCRFDGTMNAKKASTGLGQQLTSSAMKSFRHSRPQVPP